MGLQTPLLAWHRSIGAQIVDFGGWDMPIQYSSIIEEHRATRSAAGLFDISHMGRLRIRGPDAVRFLDHVLTNRVDNLKPGQVRYSLVLDESGGTLDDVLVTRLADFHLLVVNASNRAKLLDWFDAHRDGFEVDLTDMTHDWAMLACQGPQALAIAQTLLKPVLAEMRYYSAVETETEQCYAIVSRTGYTGEDGVEVIVPADRIVDLWRRLAETGEAHGLRAVGLGARDTLRLEAGMPLYGHELTETIDPLQAGLKWAVKAQGKDFVGKEALLARDSNRLQRVGLTLAGRQIARAGFEITQDDQHVGSVTSGTYAPTLEQSIAMGFVVPAATAVGSELAVVVRGRPVVATVVSLPFYQREKS